MKRMLFVAARHAIQDILFRLSRKSEKPGKSLAQIAIAGWHATLYSLRDSIFLINHQRNALICTQVGENHENGICLMGNPLSWSHSIL
ncbi:hypothetical protein ACFO1V_11230 [Daeguia caeni]|uniref:Uncharacterized protein n=1 Tax=Daeguia caeni TaxID=439612 RepID=A0ABV9H5S3_9HYPH